MENCFDQGEGLEKFEGIKKGQIYFMLLLLGGLTLINFCSNKNSSKLEDKIQNETATKLDTFETVYNINYQIPKVKYSKSFEYLSQ